MKRYLYEAFQHEESTPRAHQALALAVDSFVQVGSSSDWLRQFFDFVWDLPLPQATFNGLISSERIFKILEDFSIAFPARQRSRSGFQPKQELSRRFSILKAAITIDWSADPHHPCLRTTILALWKEKYFALAQALLQHCSPPKNIESSTDSSDALTPYGEDVQALCLQRPLLLSNLSVGSSSIAPSSAQGHQNLVANSLQSAYGHFLIDLVQQALRENLFSRPGRTRGRALLFDEAHLDSLISFLKTQLIESCLTPEDGYECLQSSMTLPWLIAHIEEQERDIADQQQAALPDLKRAFSGSEASDGGSPSARIKRVRS